MAVFNKSSSLTTLLAALGAISATSILFRLLRFSWLYIRPSSIQRYIQSDSYALVTGATGGIGRAFAERLLVLGSNVIIHGRNPDKLEAICKELQSKFPNRKILTIAASAEDPASSVPAIERFIEDEGLCVTMLINNIGGMAMFDISSYNHYADLTPALLDRITALNAVFPAQLTRALLPLLGGRSAVSSSQMAQNPKRPALIMNLGAYAANGFPLIAAYSGAKALTQALSNALNSEMHLLKQPIEVLCIQVGAVVSQGNDKDPVSLFNPTSDDFAAAALNRVGCGRKMVIGWFWHGVQIGLVEMLLPESRLRNVMCKEMESRYDRDRKGQ